MSSSPVPVPESPPAGAAPPLRTDGQPLSEYAYERLRNGIVRGEWTANQRLVEADLAEEFGISRTPLRAGLIRLADDGLVVQTRHGWVVRKHGIEEVREIYEMRMALEGFGARLAAERATDEELSSIAGYYPADLGPLLSGPRDHLVDLNRVFHSEIMTAARNNRLLVTWQRNREFNLNVPMARQYTDAEMCKALGGHHAIVDALLRRAPTAAEDAARGHVEVALHHALAFVQS